MTVKHRTKVLNIFRKIISKKPTENREPRFDKDPFFDKNKAAKYYSKNDDSYSEDEVDEKQEHFSGSSSRLKTCVSLLSLILLITVISSLTTFAISQFSGSVDISNNINNAIGAFKSELIYERDAFFNGEKFDEKLKQSLASFTEESNKNSKLEEGLVQKISQLNSTIINLNAIFDDKISKAISKDAVNQKGENEKSINTLKKQIENLSRSFDQLNKKENEFITGAKTSIEEDIKKFNSEIESLKTVLNGLKSSIGEKASGDFVTNSQFKKEINSVKSILSDDNLKNLFSRVRDGSQVDWANKYAGGYVVTANNRYWKLLDIFFSKKKTSIIEPIAGPGDCFAFQPSGGYVVIGLRKKIVPTSFTYETIFYGASPTRGSTPREIRAFAITDDGRAEDLSPDGNPFVFGAHESAQNFRFKNIEKAIDRIKFDFESNHGNPHFTCVYRLRVHGVERSA